MNNTRLSEAQQLAKDCDMEDLFERKCRAELLRLHAANLDCMAWYEGIKADYDKLKAEHEALRKAVAKFHAAKGRYHTQLAVCDLFDLCGLPNERPKK